MRDAIFNAAVEIYCRRACTWEKAVERATQMYKACQAIPPFKQ